MPLNGKGIFHFNRRYASAHVFSCPVIAPVAVNNMLHASH
ncbi:hypothetical protein DDI_3900 [Dickeya dianthicola RNS04.9]|nr:hypothetical protein DDI_3900 [Dickeya dianthicola RNS04.9]